MSWLMLVQVDDTYLKERRRIYVAVVLDCRLLPLVVALVSALLQSASSSASLASSRPSAAFVVIMSSLSSGRLGGVRIAFVLRVLTSHLHFTFARRTRTTCSYVAFSCCLDRSRRRLRVSGRSWVLVGISLRRSRVDQVTLARRMQCVALCMLHISCVALVFRIRTLHSRSAFARRICFAIS